MELTGKFARRLVNEVGDIELTLTISDRLSKTLLQELSKDKVYKIKLTEAKNKRTIYQNNMMWALLEEISKERGGERANDSWDIYLEALERAGAKYQYIAVLPEAEEMLKDQFRAVKLVNQFEHKNKTFNQYKVFYGSSKLDTAEMNKLIETVLDMAAECGIDGGAYELSKFNNN